MRSSKTDYGTVKIGRTNELFCRMVELLEEGASTKADNFTVGLTGGATPIAFYNWVVSGKALSETVIEKTVWSVSDERRVSLESHESNFGNADRVLLRPLDVHPQNKLPWPVILDPHSAVSIFQRKFHERYGANKAFDLCFLGMGSDGHTASIFPNSPLMAIETGDHFAPVDVPEKGWRFSITPDGLRACGKIVVVVTGAAKLHRLKKVLEGPEKQLYPIQILSRFPDKVEWLVDEEAGDLLTL